MTLSTCGHETDRSVLTETCLGNADKSVPWARTCWLLQQLVIDVAR